MKTEYNFFKFYPRGTGSGAGYFVYIWGGKQFNVAFIKVPKENKPVDHQGLSTIKDHLGNTWAMDCLHEVSETEILLEVL
jgi:hypothetical protein